MFLGSLMLQKRKELKLTQTELSKGICTQNTLTKIEKRNTPPSVNNLLQLCRRLGLTLNDVFTDFDTDTSNEDINILTRLESQLLLKYVDGNTNDLFKLLRVNDMQDDILTQYNFVDALISEQRENNDQSIFALDKVLQNTKNNIDNVYTLLADIYKGMIYDQQHLTEQTDYYFKLATSGVTANLNVPNATLVQKLFIGYHLADYYSQNKQFDLALHYCQLGLLLAKENNSTFFASENCLLANFLINAPQSTDWVQTSEILAKLPKQIDDFLKIKPSDLKLTD